MPSWLTDVLKLLGFTTPFIYAAATYGFFHWLDKKASGPAKKAISGWLEPKDYDKLGVQAAILEMFDRVYTKPLLSWRAFIRSTLITLIVLFITLYELGDIYFHLWLLALGFTAVAIPYVVNIVINMISDFSALFVIRRWLGKSTLRPIEALIVGPFMGILLVLLVLWSRALTQLYLDEITAAYTEFHQNYSVDSISKEMWQLFVRGIGEGLTLSALFVHLWLPFFAICVGLVKGLNYVLLATKQVQWFIKRGKDHPLDALGLVAAPLVFLNSCSSSVVGIELNGLVAFGTGHLHVWTTHPKLHVGVSVPCPCSCFR